MAVKIGDNVVITDGRQFNPITISAGATIGINGQALFSTGTGLQWATISVPTEIPSGTLMLFQQTSAPTGWTKQTTHNDKTLRVVSGAASFGGTVSFATAFASKSVTGSVSGSNSGGAVGDHQLIEVEMPQHNHVQIAYNSLQNNVQGSGGASDNIWQGVNTTIRTTQARGGNGFHGHTFSNPTWSGTFSGNAIDMRVQYVDLIIAAKN